MKDCDFAIGSGGGNVLERLCLGIPSLTMSFADNHVAVLGDLIKGKHIEHLSNPNKDSLKSKIIKVVKKPAKIIKNTKSISGIVNNCGARSVAEIIMKRKLKIAILTDKNSWINKYKDLFINKLGEVNCEIKWMHELNEDMAGDICFLIGCSCIINSDNRSRHRHNIVIHESQLPEGKGWSPLTWQILEGKNEIPINLLEAEEKVDSGVIYLRDKIKLNGTELIDEIREKQAICSLNLSIKFVKNYPSITDSGIKQKGKSSYYRRRSPKDSELKINETISNQFNLLRVVDNKKYPAYFVRNKKKYKIMIKEV